MGRHFFCLLITFIFLLYSCSCQTTALGIDLSGYQQRCLKEYYQTSTVIIFYLFSHSKNIQMRITDPNEKLLFLRSNSSLEYSTTTEVSGYYTVCLKSLIREKIIVELTIKSGVSARDYSSVVKTKDIEPIDVELNKIIEQEKILNHFSSKTLEKQKEFNTIYDKISSGIIFYSLIMIGGMIFIGVIETLYLKRFMEKRKII